MCYNGVTIYIEVISLNIDRNLLKWRKFKMKISKILAGLSAAAIAASMFTMAVSADEEPVGEVGEGSEGGVIASGSVVLSTDSWWTSASILEEIQGKGGILVLECVDDAHGFGYQYKANNAEEQVQVYEGAGDTKYELDWGAVEEAAGEDGFEYFNICLSTDDGVEYTFNWTLYDEDAFVSEYEFEYPEDAAFAAGGSSWQGVKFDEVKEVTFDPWDGIWWQLEIPTPEVPEGEEPDFTVDTADAQVVVAFKFLEDVEEGAEIFRYFDTNDGTEYSVKAEHAYKAGEGDTFVAKFDDLLAIATDEFDKGWGTGFGGNLQVANPCIISSYVTGYVITPKEDVPAEESSEESSEEESKAPTESKDTASSSKATTTATTTNPGTGAAALAVTGIALAGAAVVATKKRK